MDETICEGGIMLFNPEKEYDYLEHFSEPNDLDSVDKRVHSVMEKRIPEKYRCKCSFYYLKPDKGIGFVRFNYNPNRVPWRVYKRTG